MIFGLSSMTFPAVRLDLQQLPGRTSKGGAWIPLPAGRYPARPLAEPSLPGQEGRRAVIVTAGPCAGCHKAIRSRP